MSNPKYSIYQAGWLPFFRWYWVTPNQQGTLGHGPYPARWMAELSARIHTR